MHSLNIHPALARMLLAIAAVAGRLSAAEQPNVLWITAEDMSPTLGCYGDPDARTPRIDAFARQAVRYTHAFAPAPVCSPARSCLITGMYATSLGTQRLRSEFPIPADFPPFPAYLRAAGYYCTNNVKTDYNIQNEAAFIRAAWDDSSATAHWRGRRSAQPFFAVFNLMTTHQSRTSVWPHEQFEAEIGSKLQVSERHDPAKVTLPPFYPDTAEARRAWARYHDCITLLDSQVGEILDQLDADSLTENTIVFFYSDHGMGMPRGKRCLYDSGLRVPLLIRFPGKWAYLAPARPGGTTDRLVSFVDLAPTVLNLCGVEPPPHFQGSAFLGEGARKPREYVYGARDRVDEAFDVARSVRDERWLYIRNFMPHLPWMQPEGYSDASPFRRELKRLAAAGSLPRGAHGYAAARRPMEELYDTQADPQQLTNLASSEESRDVLARLHTELRRWQLETRDAGFLTEPQMWARIDREKTPWDAARDRSLYPLERLLDGAEAVGRDGAAPQQRAWLLDADDGVRYWAAVGLLARRELSDADRQSLRAALVDPSHVVRIEAAAALAGQGEPGAALSVLTAAMGDRSSEVRLHAARALELLGTNASAATPAMRVALAEAREEEARGQTIAMFIRFSIEAALAE
jgi:N-sulfoglucosamine sulfohydrolase